MNGLALTKVEGVAHVRLIDELVSELEEKAGLALGHTRFITMIETPESFFAMREIASASERVIAMNIGGVRRETDARHRPVKMRDRLLAGGLANGNVTGFAERHKEFKITRKGHRQKWIVLVAPPDIRAHVWQHQCGDGFVTQFH